jgi:glucose-1-phosphate thymidylyltransferase
MADRHGLLLAGGLGSRLWPLTDQVNKHLLPIYDKPLIFYSFSTLLFTGVQSVTLVSTARHIKSFESLFGDGSDFGVTIEYKVQESPDGIPDSIKLVSEKYRNLELSLVLGDNLFYGTGLGTSLETIANEGATIFAYKVGDISAFGVVEFGEDGSVLAVKEKPKVSQSGWAIPGIYFFDSHVYELLPTLTKSSRGEYEIVDLINTYLESSKLNVIKLPRGSAWLDTGTPENLLHAGEFIQLVQTRQNLLVGAPEEVAFRMKNISREKFKEVIKTMPPSKYKEILIETLEIS